MDQRQRLVPLCRTMITISSLLIIVYDNSNSNNDYNFNDEDQADDEEIGVHCKQSSIPGGAAGPRTGATCRSMHCAADQLVAMTMMRTVIMMMMMISLSQNFKDRHQSQHHFYLKGSVLSDKGQ